MAELKWISDEIKNKYNNSPFRVPLRNKDEVIVEYSLVDENRFDDAMEKRWYLSRGYGIGKVDNKLITLHHFVFKKAEENNVINHKNQDRLDNRLKNLHEVSTSFNAHI